MMPETREASKSMLRLLGDMRVLDVILEALARAGIDNVIYVGGYQIARIRAAYPQLHLLENPCWANSNMLLSLMAARSELDDDLVVSYSDIVYQHQTVRKLMDSTEDIALAVDTRWRESYVGRSQHPESEAEKVIISEERVTSIGKHLLGDEAHAEFIGLAKFSRETSRAMLKWWDSLEPQAVDQPFQRAETLRNAYLTDIIQSLIVDGFSVDPVAVEGWWFELDTPEDLAKIRDTLSRSPEHVSRCSDASAVEFACSLQSAD